MSRCILLFILLPLYSFAQVEISLTHNQPPELFFHLEQSDTTIVEGRSVNLAAGLQVFGGTAPYSYHWSGDISISDSTIVNPTVTPGDTTSYYLTVSDQNSCSFTLKYTVNTKEKLMDINSVSDPAGKFVKVYPNPNNGQFKLELNGYTANELFVSVFDNLGQKVFSCRRTNISINHTESFHLELPAGPYYLELLCEGEKKHKKFIVN